MTKKRFKPFVLPTIYVMLVMLFGLFTFLLSNSLKIAENIAEKDYTYVSYEVLPDNSIPVISTVSKTLIKPFTDNTVEVLRNYYDYKDDSSDQEKALIYYNGTYIQNAGITYKAENIFNCLSVLDGEVIDVKEDDIVGKTVVIRHNEELISVYQNLSSADVSVNDKVSQGDIIGTSGKNNMESEEGSYLHFELVYKNSYVNPEDYYGKTIGD